MTGVLLEDMVSYGYCETNRYSLPLYCYVHSRS